MRASPELSLSIRVEDRIDIVPAQTRLTDSPYCSVNPSGRVPYLVSDDGVGLEEFTVICRTLDHLDSRPQFDLPARDLEWKARRLGALASAPIKAACPPVGQLLSMGQEIIKPENEQSPEIIRHEIDRANGMADLWEEEIEHPFMRGGLGP
jgi:glutathione S-transferase